MCRRKASPPSRPAGRAADTHGQPFSARTGPADADLPFFFAAEPHGGHGQAPSFRTRGHARPNTDNSLFFLRRGPHGGHGQAPTSRTRGPTRTTRTTRSFSPLRNRTEATDKRRLFVPADTHGRTRTTRSFFSATDHTGATDKRRLLVPAERTEDADNVALCSCRGPTRREAHLLPAGSETLTKSFSEF